MRGDAVVWNALTEQRAHRRQRRPQPTAAPDGRPGRPDRRPRRLHAGGAGQRGAGGAGHSDARSTARRCRRCPAASSCACCWRRCWSAGVDVLLLDEPTNHLDILTIRWLEKFLAGYARLRGDHLARPALPGQRHHPHAGRRLRDHHALHRRLLEGHGREGGGARPQGDGGRARRGGDRAQARLRREVRGQGHQGHPGPEPAQADRAHRGRGAGVDLAARAGAALRPGAPERARGAGARRASTRRTATTAC